MLGVPIEPGNSDSQDLNRAIDTLLSRDGLSLAEAMEMVVPPIVEEIRSLPEELHARWMTGLIHCRRARLLAYRVIERQSQDRVTPADTAAYRIAVTTNDQTTADVLGDILASSRPTGEDGERWARAVEDHVRYAVSATVASGSTEVQRMLLSRALLAGAGR